MNRIVRGSLAILVTLGCAAVGSAHPGPWSAGTTGPTARYRAGSATDGTYIYIFGGADSSSPNTDAWRWDPATETWMQLSSMPTARMSHQGAYWDGKIYIPGGYTGSAHLSELAIYDIATDTWTTGTAEPAARTGTTVAYDGKIFVFGGNPGPSSETLIYDIALDSWSYGASMPVAITYGRAIAVGDYAYYVGGATSTETAAVHRYDLVGDTWITVASLQTGRMSPELMADGGYIYAVNGGGGSSIWNGLPLAQTVEIYDIATDTWTYGTPTMTTTSAPAGALAGGKFMIVGGTDQGTTSNVVQISENTTVFVNGFEDGTTGAWSATVP